MFLYFSELLGRPVIDSRETTLGKLADIEIILGEMFPKATNIIVKLKKQKKALALDWSEVQSLTGNLINLAPEAEKKFKPIMMTEKDMFLKEELFDKQVVDTYGAKIERVNDIHLLIADGDLRIVHVDIGIRGIFRRLGWIKVVDIITNWFFSYQIKEKLISWKYVQPLASDPSKKNLKLNVTLRKLHELHPSDLADIIEELDRKKRSTVFMSLDLQTAAETLQEIDPKIQVSLVKSASEDHVSDILEEMAPDEATDLLAELSDEKKQKLIETMETLSGKKLEELLKFKEGTAGSIMTKDYIALPENRTIGDVIEKFKKSTHPLETIAYVYVIDDENHLTGVMTLRHLIICEKDMPLSKLMNPNVIKVKTGDDVNDVKELFIKYKFMAIPVVDAEDHITGIITLRDVLESIFKEFKE